MSGGEREIARPLAEWHEDMGDVLWWRFPVTEAPYVGSPLDAGRVVELIPPVGLGTFTSIITVGGWPSYHTHWTPLPLAPEPPDV